MFANYDAWKTASPYDNEPVPEQVATCEVCGQEILKGEDTYWIEVKGVHQLRFCDRDEAREWALNHSMNPDYVSWIRADYYENQIEQDISFPSAEESWG